MKLSIKRNAHGLATRHPLVPWLFLLPAIVLFVTFKFVPMLRGLEMSFYQVQFGSDWQWVGLENFERAFADSDLHAAVVQTALYVAVSVIASAVIAFFLALALEGPARHLRIVRTAMFLPAVTSAAVVAQIWQILLAPTPEGIGNTVLGWFGVAPAGFFADPDLALGSLIAMQIWKTVPYDMMIFIAGLTGVNRELYDAASVDGARWHHRLWYVTLPAMRHTCVIVGVLGFIRGVRVFTEVYSSTGGGPGGATEVVMTYVYKAGFVQFDYGYASAVSCLLFVFTAVTTVTYLALRQRSKRHER
jgi:multiple sugar transport system permease protein